MKKLNLFVAVFVLCLINLNTVNALSLDDLGELLWNQFSQAIGVIFIMFAITIGVGKVWDKGWHTIIKCIMVLVVFIVEMACISVMPLGIGANARKAFGNII